MIQAGSLEPSAAPAPTMKTLDEIPPTWSQILPASERFELVMNDEAVLDKETGLVWEQSPSTSNYTWESAINHCIPLELGGRKGWHLPTIEQLASLGDSTNINPALPTGHLFSNVQSSVYWSATTYANGTTVAWGVNFNYGNVTSSDKTNGYYAWCVRGGPSYDARYIFWRQENTMARYEHLPIYKKAMDLTIYCEKIVRNFSRDTY